MGGLLEALHRASVLASVASYALPLYEAYTRRSRFYSALFAAILLVSSALHCEETGLCAAFSAPAHAALSAASAGLSLYLGALMSLVVLEIRNELVGRALMGLWALAATLRDPADAPTNAAVTALLAGCLLAADVATFRRRFAAAWWRRLALIGAMAAGGWVLFEAVHRSTAPESHAIFHVYLSGTVYLLLLAQRTKRTLARAATAAAAAAGRGRLGGGGASSGVFAMTTPTKRRPGSGGMPLGAAAGHLGPEGGGDEGEAADGDGGGGASTAHKAPGTVA